MYLATTFEIKLQVSHHFAPKYFSMYLLRTRAFTHSLV